MDWQGQRLSEQLMQYFLLAAALVSFVTGFFLSSYRMMLLTFVGGVLITFLLTVPDWTFYNRHPLQWAEPPPSGPPRSKLLKSRQQESAKKAAKPVAKR
ncbi:unnamed protein product [Calypogeia fissa]